MQNFDIDKDLYFVSKETESIKKSLTGLSHSMTGIKGDVEGLKLAVSVVAATAQLLKVDYSFWKVDEKGISFRGIQKVTWKNVRDAEKAKAKKADDNLKATFLKRANEPIIDSIQQAAEKANRDIRELKVKLRGAGQSTGFESSKNKWAEFNRMSNSVRGLSEALAGI